MIGMDILKPVVALLAWTMVMWLWMYATRIPAMRQAGIDVRKLVGGEASTLRAKLPENVSWKADNFNHLHESPTLFYAVAIVLAVIGQGDGINTLIAWAYVGLRVAHSIVQATINRIIVRFALYALSSFALMALILHAAIAVF